MAAVARPVARAGEEVDGRLHQEAHPAVQPGRVRGRARADEQEPMFRECASARARARAVCARCARLRMPCSTLVVPRASSSPHVRAKTHHARRASSLRSLQHVRARSHVI